MIDSELEVNLGNACSQQRSMRNGGFGSRDPTPANDVIKQMFLKAIFLRLPDITTNTVTIFCYLLYFKVTNLVNVFGGSSWLILFKDALSYPYIT